MSKNDTLSLTMSFIISSLTGWFKSHLDHKSKVRFYKQGVPEPKCRRKETVERGIFKTFRFSESNATQPTIRTNGVPQE